jgi:hypothetical protein
VTTLLLHLRDPLCSHLRCPLSYPDSGVLQLDPSPQALVAPRVSRAMLRNVLTVTMTDDDVALCVLFAANGNLERRVVSNVKMRQVGDECAKTYSMSPLDRPFIV